ncbi:MAG: hypothetical protein HXX11_13675 [Desulfuromonadales bacterium]|nr:hypothetical protein [Desulfuromonadales bacterium]
MATVPYKTYQQILITNDDQTVYPKLVDLLDSFTRTQMGKDLLTEINSTVHKVTIRAITDQTGSGCSPLDEDQGIVLLARGLKNNDVNCIKNELFAALSKAQKSGVTVSFVVKQIAQGLSPATYQASLNVVKPQNVLVGGPDLDRNANIRLVQLNKLVNGDLTNRDKNFEQAIRRILRPWLQAGRGCSCTVDIDLYRQKQIRSDGTEHARNVVVSLGHELVHAWHYTYGKVLTWFGENLNPDLEEVITVGLPPYNFEKFSENILRSQVQNLDLRLAY